MPIQRLPRCVSKPVNLRRHAMLSPSFVYLSLFLSHACTDTKCFWNNCYATPQPNIKARAVSLASALFLEPYLTCLFPPLDFKGLRVAVSRVVGVIQWINEEKRLSEHMQRLVELQSTVAGLKTVRGLLYFLCLYPHLALNANAGHCSCPSSICERGRSAVARTQSAHYLQLSFLRHHSLAPCVCILGLSCCYSRQSFTSFGSTTC